MWQVGYAYVDLRKLPFDEQVDQWFRVHVLKKLLYKSAKPQLRLQLFKSSHNVPAAVPESAQLACLQPTYDEMMHAQQERRAQHQAPEPPTVAAATIFVSVRCLDLC